MLLEGIVLRMKEEVFLQSKGPLWRLLRWIHRVHCEGVVPDDQMIFEDEGRFAFSS